MRLKYSLSVLFLSFICFYSFLFAQETLTITTYYPSPYGSYRELRSQRMAIGDNYLQMSQVCWGATCGGTTIIPDAADLVVEGFVGIGTPVPIDRLTVGATWDPSDLISLEDNTHTERLVLGVSNVGNYGFITRGRGMATPDLVIANNGNVGIGTVAPLAKLDVRGAGPGNPSTLKITNTNGRIWQLGEVQANNRFEIYDTAVGARLAIDNAGNVGIGTTAPTARLHVNGNIKAVLNDIDGAAAANMRYNSGTNEIGFDIAELFESNEEVEPADVLTIAENGKLQKSNKAYDTAVAGIVSEAPAVLFEGSQLQIAPKPFAFKTGKKPPLALAGRVFCKVTTSKGGPINRGDLLVTSSKPGYAMKGDAGKIQIGTVLGKALEPLEKGEGKITVLVTLQ